MNYKFAKRTEKLQASVIREILKNTSGGGTIPFAAGNPSPDAFPAVQIKQIVNDILTENPVTALQYGITEGYMPLRESLKARMGVDESKGDELIIVSGAQQGIELSAKALCDEDDCVICENPSFLGSLIAFRSNSLNLRGVDLQADGMDIDELEATIKSNPKAKIIYVIPNFQNPAGITTSMEKRRQIYKLAQKYELIIVEDNPYGDLRFSGEDVPSIKSIDTDGRVIYCGSFSKTLSPGIRVGYVWANKEIISKITVLKQVSDVHTNMLAQMLCDEFIRNYDYDGHIVKLKELYGQKCALMLDEIKKHFPDYVKVNKPQGGLFMWARLPQDTDVMGLCKTAVENGVAVVPAMPFISKEGSDIRAVRLNFSTPRDEQVVRGIEILGGILGNI